MLQRLTINGYKCLSEANLPLAALNFLAGTNSSGKSSVIQSILMAYSAYDQKNAFYLKKIVTPFMHFDDVACRTTAPDQVIFKIETTESAPAIHVELTRTGLKTISDNSPPHTYEETCFYLAANRTGPQEIVELNQELRIGVHGQYALSFFEQRKDQPIHPALRISDAPANTLKAQLAWWLSFIVGHTAEPMAEKVTATSVKLAFRMGELGEVSPYNTGVGTSYLLQLCVMCLTALPGDLLLIENPEIHLHPGAQSRLGALLAHLSANGIQLIVETHCEHLLNRIRYEIHQRRLSPTALLIHYKPDAATPFETLCVNERGHYCACDDRQHERTFPSGFFDSTLAELLEIG